MEYNFHGVTREWVKQAFTTLVGHLAEYKNSLTQWQAAATKQMVDNADRCTALEGSVSAQDTKITELTNTVSTLTNTVSAQDTKITELTNTVSALTNTVSTLTNTVSAQDTKIANLSDAINNLIAVISEDEAKQIVDDVWTN